MSVLLSPIGNSGIPFFNTQGVILSGGYLNTYLAGTTTPQSTYTDSTGTVQNANPIQLNSYGLPANSGTPVELWLTVGVAYKFVITDSSSNVLSTLDNIYAINDPTALSGTSTSTSSSAEWVESGLTPSYVSSNSFVVNGNQTGTFQPYRRLKITESAGTVYGYVLSSVFTTSYTTVTVVMDSSPIDTGISDVAYGLLSATNPSYPAYFPYGQSVGGGLFYPNFYVSGTSGTNAGSIVSSDTTNAATSLTAAPNGTNKYAAFNAANAAYALNASVVSLYSGTGSAGIYSGTTGTGTAQGIGFGVGTNTTAWLIDVNNALTNPVNTQPGFFALSTASVTSGTLVNPPVPTGIGYNIAWGTSTNTYAPSTGIYTAPVTGKYRLAALLNLANSSGVGMEFSCNIQIAGTTSWTQKVANSFTSLGHCPLAINAPIQLTAGQTVQLLMGSALTGGTYLDAGTTLSIVLEK